MLRRVFSLVLVLGSITFFMGCEEQIDEKNVDSNQTEFENNDTNDSITYISDLNGSLDSIVPQIVKTTLCKT